MIKDYGADETGMPIVVKAEEKAEEHSSYRPQERCDGTGDGKVDPGTGLPMLNYTSNTDGDK